RDGLRLRARQPPGAPGERMRRAARRARSRTASSWLAPAFGQRLSKLVQPGPDSRPDRLQGLLPPKRDLGMGQLREERALDRLPLFRREGVERSAQRPALVREFGLVVFLPLAGAQPGERPGARLVHEPTDNGAFAGIVAVRSPPDVVEDFERQL